MRSSVSPYRLGLIGCGARGSGYPLHLRRLGYAFEMVALADPRSDQAQLVANQFGNERTKIFGSVEELIEACGHDLDGVIVASPNHLHAEHAKAVFKRKLPLLLEKPVATSRAQLDDLWVENVASERGCVIGFTLRYTPFYQTVHRLIQDGVLGTILAIQAEELMSDRLSSLFSRGNWRPDAEATGGLMLEKCCHDMDIMAWLAGARVTEVQSFARRSFLHPIVGAGETCDACAIEPDCRFSYDRIMDSFRAGALDEHFDQRATQNADRRCVWRSDSNYPDHQSVSLAFENGVLGNFLVAQAQPRNERTLSILGTQARLVGEFERGILKVMHRTGPNNESIEEIPITHDGSGHGGGDSVLVRDFAALMNGEASDVRATLRDAIDAALVCLAADESVREGRMVRLESDRRQILAGR